jgi:hypothetical protein
VRWVNRSSTTNSPKVLNFVARPTRASLEDNFVPSFVRSALDGRPVSHSDIVEDVPDRVRQQRWIALPGIWTIVRYHFPAGGPKSTS